jgi:hypothetical protein
MTLKKFAWWALAAFVLWWVIENPQAAALAVRHAAAFASHAAHSVSTMIAGL